MPRFKITRTCKYTETFEIEAEDEGQAFEFSQNAEFEHQHDTTIFDEEIKEIYGRDTQ